MVLNRFLIGIGNWKETGAHLQHSQWELQKEGQDRFFGAWRAAELIEILTRLYRNAGWKKGSHTQSTTGQGYTGRRAAWLPAIWKEDKSNNKSKRKKKGKKRKKRQETSGQDTKPLMFCFSTGTGLDETPFHRALHPTVPDSMSLFLHMLWCASSLPYTYNSVNVGTAYQCLKV